MKVAEGAGRGMVLFTAETARKGHGAAVGQGHQLEP